VGDGANLVFTVFSFIVCFHGLLVLTFKTAIYFFYGNFKIEGPSKWGKFTDGGLLDVP